MSAALAGVPAAQAQAAELAHPAHQAGRFETIDHSALFTEVAADARAASSACHACEKPIWASSDEGYSVPGRGLLVFTRGDERRAEEPKLCPTCGAAIGMTMLSRWATEEDEG